MSTGKAVQILIPKEAGSFELDREALERILLQENIQNKNVVVICVAGAFRKGKSFLLSFFLRYLYAKGAENWMGDPNEPLTGFNWKASQDRVTSGIYMWSEPFLVPSYYGQQVAVLLMDTQGTFDSESTEKENSTIFALSAMLSSVLIYNISDNIYETDFLHLQRFAEYGKLALENAMTPFQKLIFLVRDYPLPNDWGAEGGAHLLEKRMQAKNEELILVRDLIKSTFLERSCFLMPHPGTAVTSSENFNGKLKDIDVHFRNHLKIFVSNLLSAENLIVKRINGYNINAKSFLKYFCSYMNIFLSDAIPSPENILKGAIESNNFVALSDSKELYLKKVKEFDGLYDTEDQFDEDDEQNSKLENAHEKIKMEVLSHFDGVRKIGGDHYSKKYRIELEEYMDEQYAHLINMLQNKKALRMALQVAEHGFKQRMDDSYGLNTASKNKDEIYKTYLMQKKETMKQFSATTKALIGAENLIPLYVKKLEEAMNDIYNFYIDLNDDKYAMKQTMEELLFQFSHQMRKQFSKHFEPLPECEFQQMVQAIKYEIMNIFDNKYINQNRDSFREKLDNEMQKIIAEYEKSNIQKLECERYLEKVLLELKVTWMYHLNGRRVNFIKKIKDKIKSMGGMNIDAEISEEDSIEMFIQKSRMKFEIMSSNDFYQIYDNILQEKLEQWKSYENFVSSAKSLYAECILSKINVDSSKVTEEEADRHHALAKSKALDLLKSEIHVVDIDQEFISYERQLEKELDDLYLYFKGLNEGKSKGCVIL